MSNTELNSLVEIYLLANTAPFLYRRMRSLPAVRRLAEESSESQLATLYRRVGSARRSAEEIALAYAALIALTTKETASATKLAKRLKSIDMEWGPAIIEMFLKRPFSSSNVEMTIAPTIAPESYTESVRSGAKTLQAGGR